MLRIVDTPSCGLFYLGGEINYKTAETYFKDLASMMYGPKPAQTPNGRGLTKATLFVWTHPPKIYSIGSLMKAYIEKHSLGTVTESPKGINYLHKEHDGAVVWTWVRDNVNFEKHCKELLSPKDVLCISKPPLAAASLKSEAAETLTPITLDNSSINLGIASKTIAQVDGSGLQCLTSQMPAQGIVRQKRKAIS